MLMCPRVTVGAAERRHASALPSRGTLLRAVPATVLFAMLTAVGCGNDDDTENQMREAIDAVCQRVETCADTTFTYDELKECRSVAGTLGLVLPDPESFGACLRDLDCSELLAAESDPAALQACVDLDPTSVRCSGDSLLACTNAGFCSEIDCRQGCAAIGAQYDSCGESDQYTYEVCRCAL